MDWHTVIAVATGFLMGMATAIMLGAGMAAGQADRAMEGDERRRARDIQRKLEEKEREGGGSGR